MHVHKTLERRADNLYGQLIKLKANYHCEICGLPFSVNELECSHFIDRQYRPTRWDENNGDCFCIVDHMVMEDKKKPGEFYDNWKKRKIGEDAVAELRRKKETVAHNSSTDLQKLIKHLRQRIKDVRAGVLVPTTSFGGSAVRHLAP